MNIEEEIEDKNDLKNKYRNKRENVRDEIREKIENAGYNVHSVDVKSDIVEFSVCFKTGLSKNQIQEIENLFDDFNNKAIHPKEKDGIIVLEIFFVS